MFILKDFEVWCKERKISENCIDNDVCNQYIYSQMMPHYPAGILHWHREDYVMYTDDLYETLLHSYDKDKLYDEIINNFGEYIVAGQFDSNNKLSKYILSIKYKKDRNFINASKFTEILNLFNYNITYIDPVERFIYLEPNVPDDMTEYVYKKCDGIVWHITKNQDTKRNILSYGLKPKSSEYRKYSERIYVIAADRKTVLDRKIKRMKKMFSGDDEHKNMALLKIDLNKYDKKLKFYIDPGMNDPYTLWTSEFIPPFCIQEVEF